MSERGLERLYETIDMLKVEVEKERVKVSESCQSLLTYAHNWDPLVNLEGAFYWKKMDKDASFLFPSSSSSLKKERIKDRGLTMKIKTDFQKTRNDLQILVIGYFLKFFHCLANLLLIMIT